MTWYPISFFPPQIESSAGSPYSGAVLKAYAAGTSTTISIATDYTGSTLLSSVVLNASGYPSQAGSVFIPHLSQNYKLALYPTQAAADANSGAVWTVDNVQIADATNTPFVQYFDGDGVTATFSLSEDLGDDEEILMVFSDRAAQTYQSNGDFSTDTIWTKGSGWTIGAGVATATGAISTAISQTASKPLVAGQVYEVEMTITVSAGALVASVGGTSGTSRNASGTYKELIISGATQSIAFTGAAFTGTLDSVVVRDITTGRRVINLSDEITLNGNQLTLNNIPPTGTKNIAVFAPSLLLGAANNAAAAAATSETNAAASATAAASSATAASASATAAAASYDSFDDRYLGSKAADPTLDNDGNALLVGALYWNSVSNTMKAYNGTVWSVAYVGAGGFLSAANNLNDVSNAATSRSNLGAAASGANSDITSLLGLSASASGGAKLRLPHGSAPSSPTDGDIWTTTAGTFIRINGATYQLQKRELYTIGGDAGTSVNGTGLCISTTQARIYIPFKFRFATAPTGVSVSNVSNFSIYNNSGGGSATALTALTFVTADLEGILLVATVGSAVLTTGQATMLICTNVNAVVTLTGGAI